MGMNQRNQGDGMSGPKVDQLEIERRRQQEFSEALRQHNRIVESALGDIRSKVSAAKAACAGLGDQGEQLASQLTSLEQRLCQKVMAESSVGLSPSPESLRRRNAALAPNLARITAETERSIREVVDRADELRRRERSAREANHNLAALEAFASRISHAAPLDEVTLDQEVVARVFGAASKARGSSPTTASSQDDAPSSRDGGTNARAEATGLLASIQTLLVSDAVDASRKNRLSAIAADIREALLSGDGDTPTSHSLGNAMYIGEQVVREARSHAELMESLYVECMAQQALVEGLGGQLEPLPGLWEFVDERELDARLHQLRDLADQLARDAYIAQALDTVMARHGYTVARSVCLVEAPQSQQRLFMAEGSDVGIHAYMGPNGSIMLETAAIGQQLRAAEDGVEVRRTRAAGAYDRIRLLESQREFCAQHQQFVAELAELGVVMRIQSDMEPSEDHAYVFEPAHAQEARTTTDTDADQRVVPDLAQGEMS